MTNRIPVTFRVRVRDNAGPTAGKTVTRDAPAFDLTNFMRTPNAEEFVKKAYFATVKKIIREIEEKKNGSVASDLHSTESIIARSLAFTKEEIDEWIKHRDWQLANQIEDIDKKLPQIKKNLLRLAARRNPFPEEYATKLADKVIAAVADKPDAVADFLFTTLTAPRTPEDDDFFSL